MLITAIKDDIKTAMKARDTDRVRTLRSIVAAVQEAEVAGKQAIDLDDAGVQKVIAAQAKRRIEAAVAFAAGNRPELEAAERAELAIIEEYLPKGLSDDELHALVHRVLLEQGFTTKADMGSAMKAVNAEVAGRADGRTVADLVKGALE